MDDNKNDKDYIKKYRNIVELQQAITEKDVAFNPKCIREKSNWSNNTPLNLIDGENAEFNVANDKPVIDYHFLMSPETNQRLSYFMSMSSPKLTKMLENIKKIDEQDLKDYGTKFKHFIFTDLKSRKFGVNVLGSGLISDGWQLGYIPKKRAPSSAKKQKRFGKIEFLSDGELIKNTDYNFYILSSRTLYDQPISVDMKRTILSKFNERPDNIYGKNVRIIIMDSGFKEGIDLFDIKYIHIFEPQETMADLKQVIGRGTRTCGQKGLPFDKERGWPLHVYLYDMSVPEKLAPLLDSSKTAFELYLKSQKKDLRLYNFIAQLENTISFNAVDTILTSPVHHIGSHKESSNQLSSEKELEEYEYEDDYVKAYYPPTEKMDAEKLKSYIKKEYGDFTWETPKIENGCIDKQQLTASDKKEQRHVQLLQYTMTQGFISNFFTPTTFVKGMLLWHSVGTGKTCTAIATASKSFENAGYTILWVTRTTLKSDVWKNIFGQSCHEKIRQHLLQSGKMPKDLTAQRKLLSKSWKIQPISYKQFTNLIEQKNNIYDALSKINGTLDPLRKTLIIIDEAHKLYGATDLSSIEQPNMTKLHEALMKSYELSGENSVRLLLMTATPITVSPMEIIQLINLLRPLSEQLPTQFASFAEKYLTSEGVFSEGGQKEFCDELAGYVSYLNLEKDLRKFAQPILHNDMTPLVDENELFKYDRKHVNEYFKVSERNLDMRMEELKLLKLAYPTLNAEQMGDIKRRFDCSKEKGDFKTICNKIVRENIDALKKELNKNIENINDELHYLKVEKDNLATEKKRRLVSFKRKIIPMKGGAQKKGNNANKTRKTKNGMKEADMFDNPSEPQYFKSPFYMFKTNCRETGTPKQVLTDYLQTVPDVIEIDNNIHSAQDNIQQNEQEMKIIKSLLSSMTRKRRIQVEGDITVERTVYEKNKKILEKKQKENKEYERKIKDLNKTRKTRVKRVLTDLEKQKKLELLNLKKQIKDDYIEIKQEQKVRVPVANAILDKDMGKEEIKKREKTIKNIKTDLKALEANKKDEIKHIMNNLKVQSNEELEKLRQEILLNQENISDILNAYMDNIEERLRQEKEQFACPPGKELNPVTGKCIKIKPQKPVKTLKYTNPPKQYYTIFNKTSKKKSKKTPESDPTPKKYFWFF